MTYNSIYGNTFKLQSQNNLINIPDFFLKLMIKIKKSGEKKKKIVLNRSLNKHENNNLQSDENIKNNAFIKKYDLIPTKKKEIVQKRKNSAFNIFKLRKRKVINEEGNNELLPNKKEEKSKELDITEKNKINGIKILPQKNLKNKSYLGLNPHNNYEMDFLKYKKNLVSDIPDLSKSRKKINNKHGYEKKFMENYANLRNFLGHLYYMKNKYKLNKTLPQNLMLGNSKDNIGISKNDEFKEQVNNLINKLKVKNKDINNRKTLNLCIVNVCSPIYHFQNDVISLTKSLLVNKNRNNNEITKYNNLAHSKSPKRINEMVEKLKSQKVIHSKRFKNNSNNNNNNIEKIKINNNINKIIKKYKTRTDFNKKNPTSNRNIRSGLTKSNSTKVESKYIQKNRTNLFQKKLTNDRKEGKSFCLISGETFFKQYSSEKEVEKLFSKEMIINDFDRRFTYGETFYYKLNKMYYEQLSNYMSHRINWELIDYDDFDDSFTEQKQFVNFEWKYYPNKLYYKKYKYNDTTNIKKLCAINLFEKNYEIGNKKKMFLHLINYCDAINLNVFNYIPFTIIINNTRFLDDELQSFREIFNLVNINKLQNISEEKNKDFILYKKYNDQFWFDNKFESLKRQNIFINKNFLSHKNYWMLKPTDLYQGKCIEISNSFNEISKKCKKIFTGVDKRAKPESMNEDNFDNNKNNDNIYKNNNDISDSYFEQYEYDFIQKRKKKISNIYISNELIIQKYLDNPLLYRKRKFDIRCFVLVDWNLNIFFCREGHLKASSFMYDINNVNKFIHITNHSFQKKSNKFERFETGNEISYAEFKNFLIEEKIPISNFDKIIKKMKFIVKLSFQAAGNKLIRTPQVLSFELFGYDFIIDNEYNPWLLEINNNPGLSISSPIISKLIPRMMDDAFRLTIDKIFNTRYSNECFDTNKNYKSKFKLEGYNDNENIFEFLCNVKDKSKPEEET